MLKPFVFMLLSALIALAPNYSAQSQETPPLTELGPYGVGIRVMEFADTRRDSWNLETTIWFPADKEQGRSFKPGSPLLMNAVPDRSGAPYPLILYSHGWGGSAELSQVMEFLASHGYVVASAQHHDSPDIFRFELVDRPLDILTELDGLAAIAEGDLAGMIDMDNIGLMGLGQGGAAVLQMLGLARNSAAFASWCAEQTDLSTWDCTDWPFEDITAYRDQLGLESTEDGQWEPFGDPRIRAVLVMTSCFFPLTTEDALASVTTPTMIMHGALDSICDYEGNALRTYSHLGTEDRYLVTGLDYEHEAFMVWQNVPQHFAAAFFGYHLQEDESYAPYLTAEGQPVWDSHRLAWGPVE